MDSSTTLNITSAAVNVSIVDVEVRDGRHAGILAVGARGLRLERILVHSHGTDGVVLTEARDSAVIDAEVHDCGCAGIRATGGRAATLEPVVDSERVRPVVRLRVEPRSLAPLCHAPLECPLTSCL